MFAVALRFPFARNANYALYIALTKSPVTTFEMTWNTMKCNAKPRREEKGGDSL